jgi:hypothetical protein
MHKNEDNGDVTGLGAGLPMNSTDWLDGDPAEAASGAWVFDTAGAAGQGWGLDALDVGQFVDDSAAYNSGAQPGGASGSIAPGTLAPVGFSLSARPSRAAAASPTSGSSAPASITVAAGATVDIAGPGVGAVAFAGSTGTLVIGDTAAFKGQVSGVAGSDTLDLSDIAYNSTTTATFLGNASGGTLTITDGTDTAEIALAGDYLSSTWTVASDGNGGTDVVDPTVSTNWLVMKVGAGGYADGLDVDPDGTMVVRTDTNGAYLWNGTSWQQLVTSNSMPAAFIAANPVSSGQGVYEIQMAPSNSSVMYMMFDGYVFVSNNKGTTWTQTSFAQVTAGANDSYRFYGQKMAVDPNNPNIVYVGTPQNGLFVTTNGGSTWSKVSGVPVSGTTGGQYPGITGILFDPAIGGVVGGVTQTLFASSYGNGVYESTNGGTTWTHLSGGPTDVEHAYVAANGAYYAVGDNETSLWRYASGVWTELLTQGQGIGGVAINPNNPNEIVTITPSGNLNVSYNGGSTWSGADWTTDLTAADIPWLAGGNTNNGQPTAQIYLTVGSIAFSATTPNELIVTGGTGVWDVNISTTSLTGTVTYSDMSQGIENLVANEILVAPGGVPLLASWDRPFFYISNLNAYPTSYGPDESDNIVAGWSLDYASTTPSFVVGIADWGSTEDSGYSTNGGQTWTKFSSELSGYQGGSIAASTPENILWAPSGGVHPYYTLNGGASWTAITLPGVSSWSGFDYGYYLTGRTVTADRVLANTFYLYYNGVYESTNGGQSWTEVYSSQISPYAVNDEIMSVPGEAGNLFFTAGLQGNGTNPPSYAGFYMSTNQGSTWTAIPNVLDVITFGFGAAAPGASYPTIYIVGYVNDVYGVWQSTNKGASWTQLGTQPVGELDQITTIAGDPNTYGQVYVGFAGGGYAYLPATASAVAPTVTGMTASPATGLEIPGSTIVITMTLSAAVTVTGTPTLSLNDGGTASYTGGSGTTALTFSYTVQTSDQDVASLAVTGVNLPSGATIASGSANATFAGALQTFTGLAIDPPLVTAIKQSPATGDYDAGNTITFTVTMSEKVTVAGGAPTLTLNDKGVATYTGGSGTSTLTFSYTVAAGQNTSSLAATALVLNGATIVNGVGAEAGISLTGLSQSGPKIDTTSPTVTLGSAGGYVDSPTQTITGTVDTADAGLTVKLFDGTSQIATAVSNATTGAWSAVVTLPEGANSLTARAVDAAGNTGTSGAVVYDWITMSVATYLASPSAADAQPGGINIDDTAANVSASFDTLNADSHLASITLSDAGILTLTTAQALDDTNALSSFLTEPTITVSDTAANLGSLTPAEIATLSSEGVTLLNATDTTVPFNLAQRQALGVAGIQLQETLSSGLTELVSYNSAGLVPSILFSGVTNAAYTSYTIYYNANWQAQSATYSNGMEKTWSYNADGSYVVSITGVTGEPYSAYTIDVSASKQFTNASFNDGMTMAWTYNSDGTYVVLANGVVGAPYTSSAITYGSNGNPISGTYNNGMIETWAFNSDNSYDSINSNFSGKPYSSYENLYNVSHSHLAIAENMTNNTGYAAVYDDDLITNIGSSSFSISDGTDTFNVTPFANETINALGGNSETFEFTNGFGQDTLQGLVATGATHDVIQFNTSMFSYLTKSMSQSADASALLSHAQQVGTSTVTIADTGSDTLTLTNMTVATLSQNLGDFKFV